MSQIKRTLIVSSFTVILAGGLSACDNGGEQAQNPKQATPKTKQNSPMKSQANKRSGQYDSQSQSTGG